MSDLLKVVKTDDGKVKLATYSLGTLSEEEAAHQRSVVMAMFQAFRNNRDFLAIPNPTAADGAAQVKALTRQMNALMRITFNIFDGDD